MIIRLVLAVSLLVWCGWLPLALATIDDPNWISRKVFTLWDQYEDIAASQTFQLVAHFPCEQRIEERLRITEFKVTNTNNDKLSIQTYLIDQNQNSKSTQRELSTDSTQRTFVSKKMKITSFRSGQMVILNITCNNIFATCTQVAMFAQGICETKAPDQLQCAQPHRLNPPTNNKLKVELYRVEVGVDGKAFITIEITDLKGFLLRQQNKLDSLELNSTQPFSIQFRPGWFKPSTYFDQDDVAKDANFLDNTSDRNCQMIFVPANHRYDYDVNCEETIRRKTKDNEPSAWLVKHSIKPKSAGTSPITAEHIFEEIQVTVRFEIEIEGSKVPKSTQIEETTILPISARHFSNVLFPNLKAKEPVPQKLLISKLYIPPLLRKISTETLLMIGECHTSYQPSVPEVRIAVVGKQNTGKSTIVNAIINFFRPPLLKYDIEKMREVTIFDDHSLSYRLCSTGFLHVAEQGNVGNSALTSVITEYPIHADSPAMPAHACVLNTPLVLIDTPGLSMVDSRSANSRISSFAQFNPEFFKRLVKGQHPPEWDTSADQTNFRPSEFINKSLTYVLYVHVPDRDIIRNDASKIDNMMAFEMNKIAFKDNHVPFKIAVTKFKGSAITRFQPTLYSATFVNNELSKLSRHWNNLVYPVYLPNDINEVDRRNNAVDRSIFQLLSNLGIRETKTSNDAKKEDPKVFYYIDPSILILMSFSVVLSFCMYVHFFVIEHFLSLPRLLCKGTMSLFGADLTSGVWASIGIYFENCLKECLSFYPVYHFGVELFDLCPIETRDTYPMLHSIAPYFMFRINNFSVNEFLQQLNMSIRPSHPTQHTNFCWLVLHLFLGVCLSYMIWIMYSLLHRLASSVENYFRQGRNKGPRARLRSRRIQPVDADAESDAAESADDSESDSNHSSDSDSEDSQSDNQDDNRAPAASRRRRISRNAVTTSTRRY